MGVRLRDDVLASFRLVARTDRWVGIDLVAGVAAYVVWVAGSAALGLQVGSLADYQVAPRGTPTTPVLGLVALLWLVLPAALGVARVRSRLLNLRDNIDQDYRLDRPAALLVPPVLLVVVLLVPVLAMGTVEPLLFAALVPATLYLLVRTTAYSYRVYAFSHPVVLYASLFVTLLVQAAVSLLYLGLAMENGAIVRATVDALGVPVDPLSPAGVAGFTVPVGLAATVALPVALVAAYVVVQTVAALVVRVRQPTVRPGRVRTGQRYPPWLEVASSGGRSSPSKQGAGGEPSASGGSPSDDSSDETADTNAASPSQADDTVDAPTGQDDAVEEDADSVSHTRVFTPPDGSGDDPLSGGVDDGDPCPDCGATVPDMAERCPACGADAA